MPAAQRKISELCDELRSRPDGELEEQLNGKVVLPLRALRIMRQAEEEAEAAFEREMDDHRRARRHVRE